MPVGRVGGCDGAGVVVDGVPLGGPPGPPWPPLDEALPPGLLDGELCGVLGVLDGGVSDGVLLGLLDELELLGVVGGVLLGVPGLPLPLSATISPLGSKRTCACQGPSGSARRSTTMRTEVCAPGASMPDTALRLSHRASAVAAQETGAVPEFQSVTVTSRGLFERCVTLMFSWPVPEVGSCDGPAVADGSGFHGTPPAGGVGVPETGAGVDGVAATTAATTCAVTVSPPGNDAPGPPAAFPATGTAGPAADGELGRG